MTTPDLNSPIPVLHLITRLIVGGAQENTMHTAALLDKGQFSVEVLSGPQTGSEGSLIEEVQQRGIRLTILPNLLRQISPVNDLIALWKMMMLLKQRRYAIVHTHSSKAGILGRFAARLAGTPIIVHTVHGWSFHDYMNPIVRLVYILLERWTASFSDALIVVAEKDITKGIQNRIGEFSQYQLIRSAIPLSEFDPTKFDPLAVRNQLGIPPDAVVIGNVGRFSLQKNPLDWVRVAGAIGRSFPNVFFLLVGDGPLRQEVEGRLVEEEIRERTLLTGLRRDVAYCMAAMDIFLLTSLWEGLPRVIPQAMAMELPVIAYRTDGVSEAIQEGLTGYLCSPGEWVKMAERCLDLVVQPQIRREMGEKGRRVALQEFDIHNMIEQIEHLYLQLLEQEGISWAGSTT